MQSHEQLLLQSLVGRSILITISDPWEFYEKVGVSSFSAHIVAVTRTITATALSVKEDENLLLQIAHPFGFSGLKCEFFVCSPRHTGISVISLDSIKPLIMNFERASAERAASDECFVAHRWKNELTFGAIGTIKFD